MKNIGVIGLGSMGMGIAQSLIRKNIPTYGFDLNPQACNALLEYGAKAAGASAIEFAQQLDALLMVVVNGRQVDNILFGGEKPLVEQLRPNTIIVLHSTLAAEQTKNIAARLAPYQLPLVDAPISGGAVKAAEGKLTVMASGESQLFDQLAQVFDAISERLYRVGDEVGLGSTVKTIHQLLAGVHIAVAAESMALAAKAGINLDVMYDIVTHAAGNSWMFENRMQHVLDGDYTPKSSVDIFVKDLGLVMETGKALNFPLPLAATAHQMFISASNEGFGLQDDSAVIKTFKGITLPEKKA
ncbi:2-(hydroxymethyl)glutarate dehydrogenase [Providencia rustigianii]|uniref:L-threonate dehydrogenase n=1 Tax=Providencia rustigianii DSM 4541 TaxID=500637 RepID=D1P6T6_9GAMM|nr:L-threonate dehydrogenase [Providencia rustigianii]EFB70783.1 phosphogluconate dehydrogenase (decarboxylating), NAD binding domain protein [Providencia rustigianii DSM 4541]MTC56167.1 NAD-binding protein [Providencia rustigianii]SPY76452.1 2-(hydroxymethyl)glutarate dehydrogenase [Providencia rustigianii]SUC25663.1 2-(hydroxymethyl)glutarate dehydrogenase [Providencia rustigianii]VEB63628.1 2-(hydroxymethyl)glutarate dehydrogenase [Providencia rustigianii]